MSTSVKIALDWKPNGKLTLLTCLSAMLLTDHLLTTSIISIGAGNHVGFYVAKAKGMYSAAGLDVTLISPHSDNYIATPASRVESGEALLAITPSETVISFNTRPASMPKPAIKAVATLLQRDDSAIVTLKSSGIDSPKKLDGKRYASYGARYEGRIVQQMIKADGGTGDYQELALPMLGLWETVLKKEADATWVFMGWEGVEAKLKGVELNVFKLGDYGIPYGYSPVVVAHPDAISSKKEELAKVLTATAEGYAFVVTNPEEAAEIMAQAVAEQHPDLTEPIDLKVLKGSVAVVAGACQNAAEKWGHMETDRWNAFLDWLSSNNLLTTKVQTRGDAGADTTSLDGLRSGDVGDVVPRESVNAENLYTNEFLP
jgi:ABC-type nitrate/sulfonate/bicarbonate transport system substrate-binding protein